MKWSDVKKKKTKAYVKWCRPTWELGLMTVWARHSHIFLTIQKFSTHIHHVTEIVRKSKKRTIACIQLSKFYWMIWVHLVSFLYSQWFTCKAYDTHKYVCIQCFKLLFKLDKQTTQWFIMIACLEFMFSLFLKKKNRGVTVTHPSIVRYN